MNQPDLMTSAQRKALNDAWDLLTEHFDRALLVLDFELDEMDEHGKRQDAHEGYWKGGSMAAIGMALYAQDRVLDSGRRPDFEPPE